ncbi:hypothetical protein HDV00_008964, partial [Rhizophlyctis rosea]
MNADSQLPPKREKKRHEWDPIIDVDPYQWLLTGFKISKNADGEGFPFWQKCKYGHTSTTCTPDAIKN